MKIRKGGAFVTFLCFFLMGSSSWARDIGGEKLRLWSKCFEEGATCIQINIERGKVGDNAPAVKPRFYPPTVVEGEEFSIKAEVICEGKITAEGDFEDTIQPVEIRAIEAEPLIEAEVVTRERLEELIPDKSVIERLLQERDLRTLAITIIRQDFLVVVKKVSGEKVVSKEASINIAKAESKEEDTESDCPIPAGASYHPPDPDHPTPHEWYWLEGRVGPDVTWFAGLKQMMYRTCYDLDHKEHGIKTRWYENGQKREEWSYEHGMLHGPHLVWYENGQKKFEEHYNEGKKEGKSTEWHENGKKYFERYYKDGKLHGKESAWKEDGRLYKIGHYKDGKSHGVWTWWEENGVKTVVVYEKGKRVKTTRSKGKKTGER